MSNEKYLYGAAVQGIQNFIFQTNDLKDIVGASELVETICKQIFKEYANGKDSVLRAAGNIKHIFDSAEECELTVREFPKRVIESAPGITISQAVVKLEGEMDFAKAVDELERKLRSQRNRPMPSTTIGLMGIKRSNNSGYPCVRVINGDYFDAAKRAKNENYNYHALCDKVFGKSNVNAKDFPFDIKDITSKNDWIAIIHADGNGLGQIVQKVGKNAQDFSDFSSKLDEATCNAANAAWKNVQDIAKGLKRLPLRPVVLGGDDLTVICRADFAIEFAQSFMKEFEKETEKLLGGILEKHKVFDNGMKKLTACAGVAFIKSSYPFYYGYELAEMLCTQAKKSAKEQNSVLAPSCLMYHKVQDSFVEDFSKIEQRELTTSEGISLKYGPYYSDHDFGPTLEELLEDVKTLDSEEGNKIKSHLRQWLSALIDSKEVASQKKKRVESLLPDDKLKKLFSKATKLDKPTNSDKMKTVAYDLLALASIKYQNTKSEEK